MKKLIHEIHKGKNLKENLKKYVELAVPVYRDYGTLELTFSAYSLVEEIMEESPELAGREAEPVARVLAALENLGEQTCDYAALASEMKELREEITRKMDLFTAYTDRLICYEYVMNRLELSYLSERELARELEGFDEEQYMEELKAYLFGDTDESVIYDKIRMVMGQIPVHITKNKLFERLEEAATLYQGQDCSSMDSWLYMLRTSAMLYEPQHYVGQYMALEQKLKRLQEVDYDNLSQSEYEELADVLETAAAEIHEITDFYYGIQKVVNGIYALCLIFPYCDSDSKLVKAGRAIWRCLAKKEYREEMLFPLEGRIEPCVEKSSYLESVLFEIKNSYQKELAETGLTQFFEDFALVANLLSDSLFIDLSRTEEKKADGAYVKKHIGKLLKELEEKLGELSRPVKRAVTAQILDKLPLPFQSASEVQEYVLVNLMGCSNKAEKCAVLTILWDLMQEEKEWSQNQ